jgi:hypothetical protein
VPLKGLCSGPTASFTRPKTPLLLLLSVIIKNPPLLKKLQSYEAKFEGEKYIVKFKVR